MSMRAKLLIIGILALFNIVLITASAMAADKPFCRGYAATAVNQYQQMVNQNMQCTGFRWHNWYDGHYKWCRKVSRQSANAETFIRANTINNWGAC